MNPVFYTFINVFFTGLSSFSKISFWKSRKSLEKKHLKQIFNNSSLLVSINLIVFTLISLAVIWLSMFSGKESLWSALWFSYLIYNYCESEKGLSSAPNNFSSVICSIPSYVRLSLIFISSSWLYSSFLQLWRNHFFWNDLQVLKIDKV